MKTIRKKNPSCSNMNRNSSLVDYSRYNINPLILNSYFNSKLKKINTDRSSKKDSIENYSNINSNRTNSSSIPNISTHLPKNNSPINKHQSLFRYITPKKIHFSKTASLISSLNKNTKKAKLCKNSFLKKSKNIKISAKDIFKHYLNENYGDKSEFKKINLMKYLQNKSKNIDFDFNEIYSTPKSFTRRIEEIKKNNIVAFKNDFDIQNYQSVLIKLLRRNVSYQNLENLEKNFTLPNERSCGVKTFKGRFVNLANKLKDHISFENREKLKMLDKVYKKYINRERILKEI